jgi:hypothetical protein
MISVTVKLYSATFQKTAIFKIWTDWFLLFNNASLSIRHVDITDLESMSFE